MSIPDPRLRPGHTGRDADHPSPRPDRLTLPPYLGTLTAARLKVTTTLDADGLLAILPPEGKPRVSLRISLPDRTVTAEIAAKSLRRAQTTIREAGADNIALVLQGRLITGDVLVEGGLSAQLKNPSPRPEAPKINHGSEAMCLEVP